MLKTPEFLTFINQNSNANSENAQPLLIATCFSLEDMALCSMGTLTRPPITASYQENFTLYRTENPRDRRETNLMQGTPFLATQLMFAKHLKEPQTVGTTQPCKYY